MPFIRVAFTSCFLLLLPAFAASLLARDRLRTSMYRRAVFWRRVPPVIAYGEQLLRLAVIGLPLLMPLVHSGVRLAGLAIYGIGLIMYLLSWVALVRRPNSGWSTSAAGLLAPAYTPAVWLVGLGLTSTPALGPVIFPAWIYPVCALAFTAFHVTHAALIYQRQRGPQPA